MCFELIEGVRSIVRGDDILSLPSGGDRAFEISEEKSDFCSVRSGGLGEFDVGLAFLQELFALRVTARKLCWFVGF